MGVRSTRLGIECDVVHAIAEVGIRSDAVARLNRSRPWLEVLPGHSTDLHDRHPRPVGQNDGHLKHSLQARADRIGSVGRESLGAVAAHQDECLASGNLRKVTA